MNMNNQDPQNQNLGYPLVDRIQTSINPDDTIESISASEVYAPSDDNPYI